MSNLDRDKIQVPQKTGRPHVVILGAGASYAAFPNGDKCGRRLPLMHNIVDVLSLRPLIEKHGVTYNDENFEMLYARLVSDGTYADLVANLESSIADYFGQLELPDEPTLYDHLLLSLRSKDVVATFNWDPFLVKAYARCYERVKGPKLIFLHGNSAIGACLKHKPATMGHRGRRCTRCGELFIDSRLLYPISQKNYDDDPAIQMQWNQLRTELKEAFMLTVFGYGAPASDVEAVALMKDAWGAVDDRQFEETEMIDIRKEDDLVQTWAPFIHSHHYRVYRSFYDSWIAKQPRRSIEAIQAQVLDARFIDSNPLPKDVGWNELRRFVGILTDDEKAHQVSYP